MHSSLVSLLCSAVSNINFFFTHIFPLVYFTCTSSSIHFTGVQSCVPCSTINMHNSQLYVKEMDITFHIYISIMSSCLIINMFQCFYAFHSEKILTSLLGYMLATDLSMMKFCVKGSLMNSLLLRSTRLRNVSCVKSL